MIRHDGTYWMFVCAGGASPDAHRIHLATSDDCKRGTRHPANPLVVDGFEARGDTWISHCGWGQGGVCLAPLRWET